MKKLFIFFGGAGSGKTTFAREFSNHIGAAFYDGDDSYTLEMRQLGHKSKEAKERVLTELYNKLLNIVGELSGRSDYVCLTHSFTQNKWKNLFIEKYGKSVVFVFVKPDVNKHLDMLFRRERPDVNNTSRSDAELRNILRKKHIQAQNDSREYPEGFVVIGNGYDKKSVAGMLDALSKCLPHYGAEANISQPRR